MLYWTNFSDGYDSNYTANTNNSKGIFCFIADTEYDANGSVNSNGEIGGISSNEDLTVHATTSRSNSILGNGNK